MAQNNLVAVGIDSGTQGTKVLLVNFKGEVLARGYAPHPEPTGRRPGEKEQNPEDWIKALKKAWHQALNQSGLSPRKIVSLGVSAQQHGFVPLDKSGRPLRPAKLWNDTSTVNETEAIRQALGGKEKFIEKVGLHLAVGYTASKILWLKKNEPANFKRLKTILLPHNYINFVLTGVAHMEYGDASGTGLMEIRQRKWQPEVLHVIDTNLEEKLPPLSHPRSPVGYVTGRIKDDFNLERVLVAAGGGDNMMAAIGTGNTRAGLATLSLGTSGTIFSYSPQPIIDPQGEIAAFCDSTGGWLPLLCTMNVTNTTEKIKQLFQLSNQNLESLANQSPPGAGGLIFLPFLNGERVPEIPFGKGAFIGLTQHNFSPEYFVRAVLEGTIFNLGYGWARMKQLQLNPSEIRVTGGGAKNKTWLKIAASILNCPLFTLVENEAAAYGAALQSIWTYLQEQGEAISLSELTAHLVKKIPSPIEPDLELVTFYGELQTRFNLAWQSLPWSSLIGQPEEST